MTKEVIINLSNHQTDEFGQEYITSQQLEGQYYEKGNTIYLLYESTDTESGSATKNTLKISDTCIELISHGAIKSRIRFIINTKTEAEYITPYGALSLSVDTEKVLILKEENLLKIKLHYDLIENDRLLSHSKMSIKVKSC